MSGCQLEPVPAKFADRWGRDWHCVDIDTARTLLGVPGVQFLPGDQPIVHKTHLPLLGFSSLIDGPRASAWTPPGLVLRSWQVEALDFALARKASLIRFDPRMGKTYVGVAAHDPATGPLVVTAPVAAREVWREWILRRWPHAKLLEAEGRRMSVEDARAADAIFIHYDILPSWSMPGLTIGTLVIDEPHRLFSHRTLRASTLSVMAPSAQRIVALDGTPIWNRPASFWALLSILAPGAWGSYFRFVERYAGGRRNQFGGISTAAEATHVEELSARLAEIVLDRSWGLDLIRRDTEVVSIDEETRIEIELQANAAVHGEGHGVACIGALRHALAKAKIPAILDAIHKRIAPGGRLVVWTWHRDVASQLVIALNQRIDTYSISGEDAPSSRAGTLAAWRSSGGILVATLGVGLVAIDLSAATQAIFAEIDWTPAVLEQAEMRIAHPSRPATVTYIVVDHPIERAVIDVLGSKAKGMASIGVRTYEAGAEALSRAFGVTGPDLERLRKALVS